MADIKQPKKKKKNKKKFILFGIIGVVILLIIIALIVSGNKEKIVTIQTEPVKKRNIIQVVSGTGIIQPETKVDISAEVSGEIIQLPVKEGEEVTKGQLLVKIKADQYSSRLQQQRAGVNYSKTQVEVAENNVTKTQLELQRIEQLHQNGLISQADLDNARIAFEVAKSQLKSAQANVNQNYAILQQSSQELSKTTINAPMTGIVTKLNSELGEKVVGTQMMAGTSIMTISDLSSMEADIEISENDITNVKIGDTATIEVDAFPEKQISGVVFEISNTAQSKGVGTQEEIINFIVKLRIQDKEVLLKPGMSCNADIKVNSKMDVIAVPIQSITAREEQQEMQKESEEEQTKRISEGTSKKKQKIKEMVFVVEGNEKKTVKLVEVKTGISDDKYIEISEGINPDVEVVKGPYKAISKDLDNGTKVKIDNELKKFSKEKPE